MAERKKELNKLRQRRFRANKRKQGMKLTWVPAPLNYGNFPKHDSKRMGSKIPGKPLRKLKWRRRKR